VKRIYPAENLGATDILYDDDEEHQELEGYMDDTDNEFDSSLVMV